MTKESIALIKLTAADGKTLTNGEIYGKCIYLGVNDTADNWHEIDDSDVPPPPSEEEAV